MHRKHKKGFTLIELLVVVAIIGMLSSIVMTSLSSARERAENIRRIADMRQIQNALELYASANNGNFPNLGGWFTQCDNYGALRSALVPTYISEIPRDPKPDCANSRMFHIWVTSRDYKVIVHLPPNAASAPRSIWDPARDGGPNPSIIDGSTPWSWTVYTDGLISQ